MDDHNARNAVARERLAAVGARLGARTVILPDGWTAAAVFAHLAFWDGYSEARLRKFLRDRKPMEFQSEAVTDLVNEAGLAQWTATPLPVALAAATAAAETHDRLIATLPADVLDAVRALGRPRLLDRSLHRNEHLDQIERALG